MKESMSTETLTSYENFLRGQDEGAWARALEEVLPRVHEVDRNAVQIWFRFFPLTLCELFERAEDPARLAQELEMQGAFRLAEQVDSSHRFLYGHRFWPEARREVVRLGEEGSAEAGASLASEIKSLASKVAAARNVEESLAVGIAAVALMTLRQAGLEAVRRATGEVVIDAKHARLTPEQILKERAKDDTRGLLGFLHTADKTWTVVWDENADDRRFKAMNLQEVASGAATDKRPWHEVDTRCTVDEGPIPVQCRSASCGTCWVGVLGGAEKLTPVAARERRMMPAFGYIDTEEPQPLIRLSCQAQATGALSVVIPPWNGYFGKYLKKQRETQGGQS